MGIFLNLQRTSSDWVLGQKISEYFYNNLFISPGLLLLLFCKSDSASRAFERKKTFFLFFGFVLFCWQILLGHGGISCSSFERNLTVVPSCFGKGVKHKDLVF